MQSQVHRALLIVALIAAGISAGCVASDVKIPPERIAEINRLAIISMEPPPLRVYGKISSVDLPPETIRALSRVTNLTYVPQPQVQTGARVMVLAYGLLAGADLAAQSQAAQESYEKAAQTPLPIDEVIYEGEVWLPTVGFAKEAFRQLNKSISIDMTLRQGVALMPGVVDRRPTFYMENWMAPIRGWYNNDRASFDYRKWEKDGLDAVLEVGMANYEYFAGHDWLVFSAFMKLVDTKTGKVIGRAWEVERFDVSPTKELFSDSGRPFREAVSKFSEKLVSLCLQGIGLLKTQ